MIKPINYNIINKSKKKIINILKEKIPIKIQELKNKFKDKNNEFILIYLQAYVEAFIDSYMESLEEKYEYK